jgi:N6-adenosine-specific RNA methylase IME4
MAVSTSVNSTVVHLPQPAKTKIDIEGGPFGFVMADPPWRFLTFSQKGKEKKSAELHYPTMTLDEIKALDVSGICDKDAFLWLWATRPMRRQAHMVMDAWGFKYVTEGAWVKTAKNGRLAFGTGYVLRDAHEPFIIAKRGKPKINSRSIRSVIMAPRREHSRKPEEAYEAASALAGDVAKADLFSRQTRPGWVSWGDEITKFDPAQKELNLARAA